MDQFRPREEQSPVRDIQRGVEDAKALMDRFLRGRGLWLIVLAVVLLYLASGLYMVGPGEKAVVLSFGKYHDQTDPGLHYRLPKPFMSHMIVDVSKVRSAEIGFRSDGNRTRTVPAESLMLTGDENIVEAHLFVQYVVQDAVKFLFGAEGPENALRASAEVALRGVVGENTIDYTMTTGTMEIQQKVSAYLQRLLNTYDTGLVVTQCRLALVDAPTQVREAFHDVVRAWEDRERLIREAEGYREDIIPKARGQVQQTLREAEAYKAQRVIRARGDAEMFDKILAAYLKSPRVTRERLYLESAERFLPSSKKFILEKGNSSVLPVLPLGVEESKALPQVRPQLQAPEPPAKKKGN